MKIENIAADKRNEMRFDYDERKNTVLFEPDGVRIIYFNPNARSGGQFVEDCFYGFLIREISETDNLSADGFFDCLSAECTRYCHDCTDVEDYGVYAEIFENGSNRDLDELLMAEIIGRYARSKIAV